MISAILLAAGQSKRMKGENKMLKKIQGVPLLERSVKNVLASNVDELIIVLGYQKKIVEKIIDKNVKIKLVFNKNFKSGIASSIKIGLKSLAQNTEGFFICLADMPMIKANIYNQLIKFKLKNDIVVPVCNGKRGHPVLFSISMKEKVMKVEGDMGAKNILAMDENKILNLEIKDQSIMKDYNTQESFIV